MTLDPKSTHANVSLGGASNRSAMVLRFCTMAARWNSSRAPERPLSRFSSRAVATPLAILARAKYARLLSRWIARIGLDPKLFGTHSLRRTKATLIYRRTETYEQSNRRQYVAN